MYISKPLMNPDAKFLYSSTGRILTTDKKYIPDGWRYWCLLVEQTQGTEYFQLGEFEFLDEKGNKIQGNDIRILACSKAATYQYEEAAKLLFDGSNLTKYCVRECYNVFCIWDMGKPVLPASYRMSTANDNSTYKGRSPKDWKIKCSNTAKTSYSDPSWEIWTERKNDYTMQNVNYTWYSFEK